MARNQTLQTITPLFGETWFEKHQRGLLWLLNFPMIRSWFRWCLKIHRYDCRTRITQIGPNRFSWGDELFRENGRWHLRRTTDFRTHPKFAKRLYYAFRPLWWTLHAWDWFIADRIVPALSWGFGSLTAYPDFALNAAGIANINKTGVSRFSTQLEWQINNSFTGTWASELGTYYAFYMADQTNTEPKLVVTYTVSGEEFIPQIQII